MFRRALLAVFACLLSAAPSAALAGRQLIDGWPLLASARDGDCHLTIRGNGKFMSLTATGLEPHVAAHFRLANAAMKPVDRPIRASGDGSWSQLYIPFLWGNGDGTTRTANSGGTVDVQLASGTCTVAVSADWSREIRIIR